MGALVCAIVGLLVCAIVLGPVALVLASNAQKRIDASYGALTGSGLVTAARVIAIVAIVLWGLYLLVVFGT
ncbi:MAG: DUF4190 domain-containing protein [Acidimicrobiia bacterium]|nr:DUF4190 domain-containing protein [Acidimicrobiia bacterium]